MIDHECGITKLSHYPSRNAKIAERKKPMPIAKAIETNPIGPEDGVTNPTRPDDGETNPAGPEE
jgi:hypothetical protein